MSSISKTSISLSNSFAKNASAKLGILGVPFDKGQLKRGTNEAPDVLRKAGLVPKILNYFGSNKVDIRDYGNISCGKFSDSLEVKNMKNYSDFCHWNSIISDKVAKIIRDDRICLSIGGDHAIGLGTVHGHLEANPDICLLWIDAHADLNTNYTSESGNTHGMPVALLLEEFKRLWSPLPNMSWLTRSLPAKRVAYIGLRSVDPAERYLIDKYSISAFYMDDIKKHGIDNVLEMALRNIDPEYKKPIHVSFDIDSVDPSEAPSTGTAVNGGLSLAEAVYIMETISATNRLEALDIVEVNPKVGSQDEVARTVDAALDIIVAGLSQNKSSKVRQSMVGLGQ